MEENFFNEEMLGDFIEEARELLEVLNTGILELEKAGGDNLDVVNEIFRSAHSLKGMSGMMGFNNMNHLTHTMENVLDEVRNGKLTLTSDDVDILFDCLDKLNDMTENIINSGSDDGIEVEDTVNKLVIIKEGSASASVEKSDAQSVQTEDVKEPQEIEASDNAEFNIKYKEIITIEALFSIGLKPSFSQSLTLYDLEFIMKNLEQDFNLYQLKIKYEKTILNKNKSLIKFYSKLEDLGVVILAMSDFNNVPELEKFDEKTFDLEIDFIYMSKRNISEILKELEIEKENFEILIDSNVLKNIDLSKIQNNKGDVDEELITPDIIQSFKDESTEHLTEFSDCLLVLEKNIDNFDKEIINTMFRSMHTLKGLANMFGFISISELCHALENMIEIVRTTKFKIDSEYIDVILKITDVLSSAVNEIINNNVLTINVSLPIIYIKSYIQIINPLAGNSEKQNESGNLFGLKKSELSELKKIITDNLKNVYLIDFDWNKDFEETSSNYNFLLDKITLFGDVYSLSVSNQKIENIENLNSKKVNTNIQMIFISDEEIDSIYHIMDKTEKEVKQLDPSVFREEKHSVEKPLIEKKVVNKKQDVIKPKSGGSVKMKKEEKMISVQSKSTTPKSKSSAANSVKKSAPAAKKKAKLSPTVRVDIEKLDTLMNLVGELVIDKTRVEQIGKDFENKERNMSDNLAELRVVTEQLGRVTNDLQEAIMKTRMVPVGTVFNRFPRVVRDISKSKGKKINLVIEGEETELDKTVIEEIGDPMVHLIRNAVDHGIETPEVRKAAGKSETGILKLNAYHEGNHIIIEISDDGAGINPEIIKNKAIEKGIATEEEISKMTKKDIINFIFAAGFSTATKITDISGRGVGMDVVKSNIAKLKGLVDVESELGKGSTFTIKLPLTLAIINALLVEVGEQVFAIPLASVIESVRVDKSELKSVEGRHQVIKLRDSVLPVMRLSEEFYIESNESKNKNKIFVVILGIAEERIALIVDSLLGQREIVIKSLEHKMVSPDGIAGATILGDGRVVLIVDVSVLVNISKQNKRRRK